MINFFYRFKAIKYVVQSMILTTGTVSGLLNVFVFCVN